MLDRHDAPDAWVVETLTRREREILALLAEGLTGPEMAVRLTLALSSVKSHLQHLYGKLGVNSKRQAVSRAQRLGMLYSAAGAASPVHDWPQARTCRCGGEVELARGQERLAERWLVTLIGPGGVRRTRLEVRLVFDNGEPVLEEWPRLQILVAMPPV
jgi:DNA-binding CsgD family transcriptional regulator